MVCPCLLKSQQQKAQGNAIIIISGCQVILSMWKATRRSFLKKKKKKMYVMSWPFLAGATRVVGKSSWREIDGKFYQQCASSQSKACWPQISLPVLMNFLIFFKDVIGACISVDVCLTPTLCSHRLTTSDVLRVCLLVLYLLLWTEPTCRRDLSCLPTLPHSRWIHGPFQLWTLLSGLAVQHQPQLGSGAHTQTHRYSFYIRVTT